MPRQCGFGAISTRRGERVQITSHRKVVAELVMPLPAAPPSVGTPDEAAMQTLLSSGFVADAATKPFKLGKAINFAPGPRRQSMSDLVIALRGAK